MREETNGHQWLDTERHPQDRSKLPGAEDPLFVDFGKRASSLRVFVLFCDGRPFLGFT